MLHIRVEIGWSAGRGKQIRIDPALFGLLAALRTRGSLKQAAESEALSYRHAWGLVRDWEARFRAPLVRMQRGRGHGARLTEFAEQLLQSRQRILQRLDDQLAAAAAELDEKVDQYATGSGLRRTTIAASHGMAIARLSERLSSSAGLEVQLLTRGSIESLRLLARGECDAAGFHMPVGELAVDLLPGYGQWLPPGHFRILLVSTRRQGIMTRRSNPKRIRGVRDLSKRSVRFINRQPDSGTRIVFDALLRREGLDAGAISGYANEEFTHLAVAAMVAGGAADAAFGIAAAAAQFHLHFIPLVDEAYCLAVPAESAPLFRVLKRELSSAEFRADMRGIEGYDARQAGRLLTLQQITELG
jgi:putative molybdopterin biosynthesis protein